MDLSFKLILRNELFSMSLRFHEAASRGLDGHLAHIHHTLYFNRKCPQELYNVTQLLHPCMDLSEITKKLHGCPFLSIPLLNK